MTETVCQNKTFSINKLIISDICYSNRKLTNLTANYKSQLKDLTPYFSNKDTAVNTHMEKFSPSLVMEKGN